MFGRTMHRVAAMSLLVSVGVGAWSTGRAAAGSCPTPLPQGGGSVTLDPADFTGSIDNPYWPMAEGSVWIYRETDPAGGKQTVRVSVTDRTKEILGIQATVVHDVVREHGELIENTWDWYAQDACGNVWYLGEATKEYEDGVVVSTEGSWEAGVDGAQAGVVVPADPAVGMTYRQEFYEGQAEDRAEILSVSEQAEVPAGHFSDVLLTKDLTPLRPKVLEYKLYAPGVGPALVFGVSGGSGTEELIRYVPGTATVARRLARASPTRSRCSGMGTIVTRSRPPSRGTIGPGPAGTSPGGARPTSMPRGRNARVCIGRC